MNTRILPIKANSSTPTPKTPGWVTRGGRENVKSTGPNRKYQRRESFEQTDVIYLLVMIMNRKTNRIFSSMYIYRKFFSTVLGVRHFADSMTEEEEYRLKRFVNHNIRSTDNVCVSFILRRVHVTIVAVEEQ